MTTHARRFYSICIVTSRSDGMSRVSLSNVMSRMGGMMNMMDYPVPQLHHPLTLENVVSYQISILLVFIVLIKKMDGKYTSSMSCIKALF